MNPLISIIVCTRNRSTALIETISHYRKIRFDDSWEIILVDNNSTDDTPKIIDNILSWGLPIIATRCDMIGLGAAREHGRRLASGQILLFTDDDCYPEAGLLEAYRTVFSEKPSLGYCGGRILLWDQTDILLTVDYRDAPAIYPPQQFVAPGHLQGANLAIKANVLEAIGGVDVSMGAGTPFPCEDIDMVIRAGYAGFTGGFDPRPIIYHHHQRKEEHRAGILASYDKGRGALYMKLLLRPDTRRDCAKQWYWALRRSVKLAAATRSLQPLKAHQAEILSTLRFLIAVVRRRITHTLSPSKK